MTQRLFLLRHGEVTSHRGDVPVTEEGLQTAVEVGRRLAGRADGAIRVISGETRRTRDTAAAVARGAREAGAEVREDGVAFALRNPDLYLAGVRVDMVSSEAAFAAQIPGFTEADVAKVAFFTEWLTVPDRVGWWVRHPEPPGDDAAAVAARIRTFAGSLADREDATAFTVADHPLPRACAPARWRSPAATSGSRSGWPASRRRSRADRSVRLQRAARGALTSGRGPATAPSPGSRAAADDRMLTARDRESIIVSDRSAPTRRQPLHRDVAPGTARPPALQGGSVVQRVTPHVFTSTEIRGCNPSYVVTSAGVVVIDTPQLPTKAVAMRQEAEEHGPDPLRDQHRAPRRPHLRQLLVQGCRRGRAPPGRRRQLHGGHARPRPVRLRARGDPDRRPRGRGDRPGPRHLLRGPQPRRPRLHRRPGDEGRRHDLPPDPHARATPPARSRSTCPRSGSSSPATPSSPSARPG